MNIEIVTRHVNNEPMVREYIQQKVEFSTDRFAERINHITIRLEDETKNSPAFDGLCQIDVILEPRGHIHVSARGELVFDCVSQAIRKMEAAIKHDIDRHRHSAKVRHQKAKRKSISSLTGEDDAMP